ncbi:hypothetical protein INS49_003393 [Diaporthe citri]|uniref:uncharacterized protein n=1 Tax=Diaporthe citri TaxID=83186 RepID=UPI001C81C1C0|nr:uncharacterized protein INS49_003393 [Diaporthe citri]KAG6355431.1 hypothetical protein INS49_003393 [Diaporthe citri]
MNLLSALACLLASSACAAASPPAGVNDKDCRAVHNVTKSDVDRFLGFQFDLPTLCGVTDLPEEAIVDLQLCHKRGPAGGGTRGPAFEFSSESSAAMRRMSYGGGGPSAHGRGTRQTKTALESPGDFDGTDYEFENWMLVDADGLCGVGFWVFKS